MNITFVVAVNDEKQFADNLLCSPCLAQGTCHEVLPMRGYSSAADALNEGIRLARHEVVVCVHQDVYLPKEWEARFLRQMALAREQGPLGVVGVYGILAAKNKKIRIGRVMDRGQLLEGAVDLPAPVDTLDELLLAVPKDTPLRFDPRLGFHFYGADLCLQARKAGRSVLAIDALCFHNSSREGLDDDFYRSGKTFAHKWADELPILTTCARVDHRWIKSPPRGRRWPWKLSRIRRTLAKLTGKQ